jgi:hypothetical protein
MLQHLDSTKYYRKKWAFRVEDTLRKDYKKKRKWIKRKKKKSIICYQSQFRCFY